MYLLRDLRKISREGPTFHGVLLWVAYGMTALLLSGCVNDDMSDLRAYKERIHARKSTKIEQLPEIKPYDIFSYVAAGRKDPFRPLFDEVEPKAGETLIKPNNGLSPDFNRIKQELEQFPLDSLRMVGTLESIETNWGIVVSNDGTVHRVKVGDYLGQNHGKIIAVDEEGLELNEVVPNGLGGWQERAASLALIE